MRDPRWLVGSLAALILLAGCGGRSDATSPLVSGEAMAALAVIDDRADHRPVTATAFEEADDGRPLEVGDAVRTDATGFAEIVYADGSLTRLDRETTFTVTALDGDVTVPEIETSLDAGRIWNRVNSVTGQRGRFEVETAVGVATVRGTAFGIACIEVDECTFTVTEGVVVVLTPDGQEVEIRAGEAVTIGVDGQPGAAGGDTDGRGTGDDPGARATTGATDDGADSGSTDGRSDDGADSGSTDRRSDDGSPGGSTGGTDGEKPGGAAGTGEVTVTLLPTDGDVGDDGAGALAAWTGRNADLDERTDRFGGARESCSVTVGGRNVDHADSPDTAIEVGVDDTLRIDAVATGPLDTYRVDLRFAGIDVRAAEGTVQPDTSGDRTGFRGEVDVGQYARWGVGLYEVHATTTGTRCDTLAFVNVTGRHPLTTGTGIAALLLALGGTAGLISAINLATGERTAAFAGTSTAPPTHSTSSPTSFTSAERPTGSHEPLAEEPSTSWWRRLTDVFRSGGAR